LSYTTFISLNYKFCPNSNESNSDKKILLILLKMLEQVRELEKQIKQLEKQKLIKKILSETKIQEKDLITQQENLQKEYKCKIKIGWRLMHYLQEEKSETSLEKFLEKKMNILILKEKLQSNESELKQSENKNFTLMQKKILN
jgi:hypothetical protein